MNWIFRVGFAAAVALGALTAGAEDSRFVYEVTNIVNLAEAKTEEEKMDLFAAGCDFALTNVVEGKKEGEVAHIILVTGSLTINYGDKCQQALNRLFSSQRNRKIALLCNCPDFQALAKSGTTFSDLKEKDLNAGGGEICIYGRNTHFAFHSAPPDYSLFDNDELLFGIVTFAHVNAEKETSENYVGLIYGVTFMSCGGNSAGAVADSHRLRFVNCKFKNCSSNDGRLTGGGAINRLVPSTWLKHAFIPRQFGPSFTEMTQKTCSFCTFDGCWARNNGGALYTHDTRRRGCIADCVFIGCHAGANDNTGYGGAVYNAETIERSIFRNCTVVKGKGGAFYDVNSVSESLFVAGDNTAPECGAGGSVDSVDHCTFSKYQANAKEGKQYVIEDDSKVSNSIFVGTDDAFRTYDASRGANTLLTPDEAPDYFVSYNDGGGDFHLKPDKAKIVSYSNATAYAALDLDRLAYNEPLTNGAPRMLVRGCYRYNTPDDIKEQKKDRDISVMNPLIVTTPEDVVDPFDGQISFREACSNLMARIEAPKGFVDQWPRITFSLPSNSRYIVIRGDAPHISDELRTDPLRTPTSELERFKPIEIDGGEKGMTVRRDGTGDAPALRLNVAGTLRNLSFDDAPVEVGTNLTAKLAGADTTLYMTNCAFTGGSAALSLVRASGAGTNGFAFTHCSFVNPENATAAVSFEQTAAFPASFTCCTFAGFDKGDGAVVMPDAAGRLSFGSCTFALNGAQENPAFADIWIGDGVTGGSVRLADCLFADGPDRVLRRPETVTTYGTIATEVTPGVTMDNFAGIAATALGSATPDRLVVGGVSHIAFAPKHGGSARLGKREILFEDGTVYEQPKTDIFGAPQTGGRTSLGSRFVDDVETRSMTVDCAEDIEDPYDDRISLREAIAYGLRDYRQFARDRYLTPLFVSNLCVHGSVRLTLDRAIDIGDCLAFTNKYAVWIKPGKGDRLVLGSNPIGGEGLFRQAAGTELRFDDVLFTDCSNYSGPGGVLDSDGRVRFNRCRFENSYAAEVKIVPAARALAAAYKPVLDTLALSADARKTVLFSIPPDRRGVLANAENAVSGTLAACSNTVRVLRDVTLSFEQRLAGVNACLTNFLAVTENVTEPFNVFCLFAQTIAMRLNVEGIPVNEELLLASLASARASLREFESLRKALTESNGAIAVAGSGGAINLREKGECIVYDASARGCGTFGDGGFLANRGDFKGVNLTLTGNNAIEGGCICNLAGTNQLASVAIVDNDSEMNGAVSVRGGAIGLLNSIVIANKGGNLASAAGVTVKNVHSLVEGDTPIALGDVFSSAAPLEGGDTNHLFQLYYPLKPNGRASHTGTFVFFNSDTTKMDADGVDSEWIKNILHETNPDGVNPDAQWFFGSGRPHWNAYLLYDLLGNLIRIWENKETFEGPIAASMGPVPNVPPEQAGALVTTFDDVVSSVDNKTSLREAAAYAMAMSTDRVVCVSFASAGIYELKNQIVVPSGKTLCIAADPGAVTLKPAKAYGNRFFRVERGGRLLLSGLVMDGGYAKGEYAVGTGPANDDNGGAICSEGELVLSDCTVQQCKANGFGGAVWSSGGMTAVRCAFTGNFAQCGGGICSYDEPLRLSGVSITGNTAQDYGGGLYLVTGPNDVTATGATITGNTANGETVTAGPNRGGGVYLTANMSANPGTVTIFGTVSGNTGGNDSRDGGTEPVSPVQTSETPDKEGTPIQPPRRLLSAAPRLMSAANALAATPAAPQREISTNTKQESLTLNSDLDASEQVCVTGGAVLTLTGKANVAGTVSVSKKAFPEGCHPRITVEKGAKLVAERGFYRGDGSSRAELVLDNGTAELSGGAFVANAGGSSGTITLRNGAVLDAPMDITLNSAMRTNTVSDSTVDLGANALSVVNGARLEMSDGSTLLARLLEIDGESSVALWGGSNVLTAVNVRSAGLERDALVVTGGTFRTGALSVGPSRIEFGGGVTAAFGQIGLGSSEAGGSCALVFDAAAAVCAKDVDMQSNDIPLTLEFRGADPVLEVGGDFLFGNVDDVDMSEFLKKYEQGKLQIHRLSFDIPRKGWTEPPLRIGGKCRLPTGTHIVIPSFEWMGGASNCVPLVRFSSRPEFLTEEWLEIVNSSVNSQYCALKYDEETQVLSIEYAYNSDGSAVCEVNGLKFSSVEMGLASAREGDTVRLLTSTRAGALSIPDFVTLDLCGFTLSSYDDPPDGSLQHLPEIRSNGGVLVAYGTIEVDALFDNSFVGTMRFGRTVVWDNPGGGGSVTFPKGTDVTVRSGGPRIPDVYVVTTSFSDTYGLSEGWSVHEYGSAELGGRNYRKCSLVVDENAHIVTPMKLVDSTLAVSGTVSFAEGAYIELGSMTNGGVYARHLIDLRYLRVTDPSKADVTYTELPDGAYWYHPSTEVLSLVAEVDGRRYTLREAFDVANGNGHSVTLLRDDADDAGTISVGRSIAFDMNGRRICGAGGTNLTFSVSNGGFAVLGSEACSNVTFRLGHGNAGSGALVLSGGSFAVTNGPAVAVDAACTAAAIVLTDGAELLAPAAVSEIIRLDGFADCLFDNATVRGDSATNAIVHHSARIVVTNGAALVSKGVTIRQTASGACPDYRFTLEMSGTNSLVRTLEGAHCVASALTPGDVKSKTVENRFTCTSGDFECPKSEENAAVAFFGDFEYDVTGGRFGGSVAPPASPKFAATEVEVPDRGLYWEVIRLGEEGVYVAVAGDEPYESLEEAFEHVAPGGVVTMIADIAFRTSVAVDRPAILDLNGFHLSGKLIDVAKGTALTIVDTIGSGVVEEVQFAVSGTLTVKAGKFVACEIVGDGSLEFLGGEFDAKTGIAGTGPTALVIRDGTFRNAIMLQDEDLPATNCFRRIEVSGGEYHPPADLDPFHADDTSKTNLPTAFLSGGVMHTSRDAMPEKYLVEGYRYEGQTGGYRVVKANAEPVAEVDGEEFTSLREAFAKADKDKPVTLLRDYDCTFEALTVPRSFTLNLNDYRLSAFIGILVTVTNGVSLTVDGLYDNSVCSNVCFIVSGEGSSKGALHLAGGRYCAYSAQLSGTKLSNVAIMPGGTCQVDYGAVLEGTYPVRLIGGALTMTRATVRGTEYGIACTNNVAVTNVLCIGSGAKVSSDKNPPLSFEKAMLDLDISGDCEFHAKNADAGVVFAASVKPDQAGISGGRFYGARPDDKCLTKGYAWAKKVPESGPSYWTPQKNPDVVEVNGVLYDNLVDAFAAASRSGRPVKLVTDYTYGGGPLSVSKSFSLDLNNHVFAPYAKLDISITGGATFGLNGNSVCSNVHFVVGNEDGSATGAVHLASGRYYGGVADEIVTIGRGTCLIDGEANLEGKRPVGMYGGTLAMTNATIHGTEYGIYAAKGSVPQTNTLRIGKDAKVSSDEYSPLFLSESDVDLDISGNCEFRPKLSNIRAIDGGGTMSGPLITGGSFYGAEPSSSRYLNLKIYKGWVWLEDAASEPYWTPEEMPDVAEVDGRMYKRLSEAFNAANECGKSVKLVADYTGPERVVQVSESYAFELNNHIFAPSDGFEIQIYKDFKVDCSGANSVCSNVHFIVESALHLAGGRYCGANINEIVTINGGTCLIDGGATLEGKCPVRMYGGTLAMTNATIRGTEYGIRTKDKYRVNILRIGNGVKVASDGHAPLYLDGDVNLDISGNCEFRPKSNIRAIDGGDCVDSQAGISGGYFYGKEPDDDYLSKDCHWENVGRSEAENRWTPRGKDPVVAEVNGTGWKTLREAFDEANKNGGTVKLLLDYTYDCGSLLDVTKSFVFDMNNFMFVPRSKVLIRVLNGASLELKGMDPNSTCSNVHFDIGREDGSTTGVLHLDGGRYAEYNSDIVRINLGTCLIDGGATLEGWDPVYMGGGTLAMTNATINGTDYGIYAFSGQEGSEPSILRIGRGVVVRTSNTIAPLCLSGRIDLGISENCEFRAKDANTLVIDCDINISVQTGISGGRFYGKMPDNKDMYLAAGYVWAQDESRSCWTPMKATPSQPTASDGTLIEDGGGGGDSEITDAPGTGKDSFTVTFDLGEHAVAFVGETNQVVAFGESATEPVVTCEEGYALLYWDKPFDNVRAAMTVKAVYGRINPEEPGPQPGPSGDQEETNVIVAVSKAGWHEMSFPVLSANGNPATVFAPVESKIGYVTSGSLNWNPATGGTLVTMEIGNGYWVQTTVPNVTWAVVGQGNPTVEIALKSGWNLVGYPLLEAGEIETVLATALATGKILYICSESKVYPGTLTTLVPGKGYWVYADEAAKIRFDAD